MSLMTLSRIPRRKMPRSRTFAVATPAFASPSEASPPQTIAAAVASATAPPPAALSIPLAILDDEDDAIIVLSPGGARLYANRSADVMIDKGELLTLAADVVTVRPGRRREFAAAFARSLSGETSRLDIAFAKTVWTIKFTPLETPFARLCMLRVGDLEQRLAVTAAAFAAAHGLSRREGALMLALAQGKSLEDHAHERQVAISTVRSQLGALFRKCGTTRQHELVAKLYAAAR